MKLNKKGFTLVELLAVIVVLAIIALIGYTVVGDVITTSQKSGDEISVQNFAKSISQKYLENKTLKKTSDFVGTFTDNSANLVFDATTKTIAKETIGYSGDIVTCQSGTITSSGTVTLNGCTVNGRDSSGTTGNAKPYYYCNNEVKTTACSS